MGFFSLFQPKKSQSNLDPHQKEIQDFKIQLATISNGALISNFRSDVWEKINDNDKRIAILQEVENRNALQQGREPCKVKIIDSSAADYGLYSSRNNTISVNINEYIISGKGVVYNSSYEVLDTIYHEGEHAYQDKCIKTRTGLPKTTIDMCEVENIAGNYMGKIPYNHCTCEIDSNNFAVNKVMEVGTFFEGDPRYSEYLEKRSREMKLYTHVDMEQVRSEQLAAIQNGQSRCKMSISRCRDIRNNIARDQKQPAFEEAKIARERLIQEKNRNDIVISEKNIYTQSEIVDSGVSEDYSEEEKPKYRR